jgi:sedoheptulokinase
MGYYRSAMTLVGLDIGTTTICGLLLNASSGEILAVESERNVFGLPGARADEALQDPEAILGAAERILGRLIGGRQDVKGLGVTGQMHGILYADREGRAASPLYTWQDGRGEREHSAGKSYAAVLSELLGSTVSTGMGFVTHYWNLRNESVPAGAAVLCTIADYVAMRLAGAAKPRMDATMAASLGCFDLRRLCFRTEAMVRLQMDPALFPPVVTDYPALGRGPEGIPVFAALGDNQASILGSASDIPRSALVNIGTGSQVSVYTPHCTTLPGIDTRPFPFGGYILVGAGLCGGKAYSLLHDFFERTVRLFTGGQVGAAWDLINEVGPERLPGFERLIVDTRFSGTRADPGLRGGIGNLGPETFTPEQLIVGVREGMAAELFGFYERFGPDATRNVDTLVGAGNGIRLNPDLRRALEQRFGLRIRVPAHREEASFGAALLAGVAGGVLPDLAAAGALIRYGAA